MTLSGFTPAPTAPRFLIVLPKHSASTPIAMGGFVWRGRAVRAIVDPIGIDAEGFADRAREVGARVRCPDAAR